MDTKLRIATYGACHASGIRTMLLSAPASEQHLSIRDTKGCFAISDEEYLEFCADLKNYDLLIYQPISSQYKGDKLATARLLENCPLDTAVLSFQYFQFELYTPFMLDRAGELTPPPFEYLDYHLAVMIARGLPDGEIIERLDTETCIAPHFDQMLSFCFENLREREARVLPGEKELDVKISDFVENNFREHRLSYTFNHPTKVVLDYILAEIFERNAAMRNVADRLGPINADPLDVIQFRIPKFIRSAYGLSFDGAEKYVYNGREIPVEEYVSVSRLHFEKEGKDKILDAVHQISIKRPWYSSLLSI